MCPRARLRVFFIPVFAMEFRHWWGTPYFAIVARGPEVMGGGGGDVNRSHVDTVVFEESQADTW